MLINICLKKNITIINAKAFDLFNGLNCNQMQADEAEEIKMIFPRHRSCPLVSET